MGGIEGRKMIALEVDTETMKPRKKNFKILFFRDALFRKPQNINQNKHSTGFWKFF